MRGQPKIGTEAHVPATYTDYDYVWLPSELEEFLAMGRLTRRLVWHTAPKLMPDRTHVRAVVRLLDHAPLPVRAAAQPKPAAGRRTALIALGVLAGLAALGYLVAIAVQALIAAVLPYALGGLLVVVAVWFALGQSGRCVGIHCPGCGH